MKQLLLTLVFLLSFTLPASAQEGAAYRLTVEGQVINQRGIPSTFTMVILTTDIGEVVEAQTDHQGYFTLTAAVRGKEGTLAVKSAFAEQTTFGKMSLTWGAGGPGEKHLVANVTLDGEGGMSLQDGGTEPPLPGETPSPGSGPQVLPTVTATEAAAPSPPPPLPPESLPPTPEPSPAGGGRWLLLATGLLLGVGLIGGGVWWLKQQGGAGGR